MRSFTMRKHQKHTQACSTQRNCSGQEPGILHKALPKPRARSWALARILGCSMCSRDQGKKLYNCSPNGRREGKEEGWGGGRHKPHSCPVHTAGCSPHTPTQSYSKLNTKSQFKNSHSFYMIITVIITGLWNKHLSQLYKRHEVLKRQKSHNKICFPA